MDLGKFSIRCDIDNFELVQEILFSYGYSWNGGHLDIVSRTVFKSLLVDDLYLCNYGGGFGGWCIGNMFVYSRVCDMMDGVNVYSAKKFIRRYKLGKLGSTSLMITE